LYASHRRWLCSTPDNLLAFPLVVILQSLIFTTLALRGVLKSLTWWPCLPIARPNPAAAIARPCSKEQVRTRSPFSSRTSHSSAMGGLESASTGGLDGLVAGGELFIGYSLRDSVLDGSK